MTFKDHFSGHAADYRDARPLYPDALFDWLTAQAPDHELAWDAGCGNGQASVALAERFAHVHASDPSANQIANAETRANIDYRVEPAEHSSLARGSASLITVAQALHWFDFAAFYTEARRVLKPGGLFAAWSYSDCRVSPAIDVLKDRVYVDLVGPYWPPERALVDAGYRTVPMPFDADASFREVHTAAFEMQADWNVEHFLAYLRSWSATQRYVKERREDPVARIENELRKAWGDADNRRVVHWDFHMRCARG